MRKPNYKKWSCPIDGKEVNSRGAPAYVRNKFNIPWNKDFLANPKLLVDIKDFRLKDEYYLKIRGLFTISKEYPENNDLVDKISERLFSLCFRIRRAIEKNDKNLLLDLYNRLSTASKFKIIKKIH